MVVFLSTQVRLVLLWVMHFRDDGMLERAQRPLVGHIVIPGLPKLGGCGIESEKGEDMVGDMILF